MIMSQNVKVTDACFFTDQYINMNSEYQYQYIKKIKVEREK